jgi:hypothetical protein
MQTRNRRLWRKDRKGWIECRDQLRRSALKVRNVVTNPLHPMLQAVRVFQMEEDSFQHIKRLPHLFRRAGVRH